MQVKGVPHLWTELKKARSRFLAIDYDGTLAPFRIERMDAFPVKGADVALEHISHLPGTGVAVISGRPVHEVTTLLGLESVTIIGAHGWEEKKPGQPVRTRSLSPVQATGLDRAKRLAALLCDSKKIESKAASVAIHTRGMDTAQTEEIRSGIKTAWSKFEAEHNLEIRLFNGGIELRAIGWDKGRALETLMGEHPSDTYFIYIGDDQTDEDAFKALRNRGTGIRVGPEDSQSHATGFLKDCEAVAAFLDFWLETFGHKNTEGF